MRLPVQIIGVYTDMREKPILGCQKKNHWYVLPMSLRNVMRLIKGVPLILSAASADNFEIIYKQKSIITAFKEAGFKTAFLSNQVPNNTFTDFFFKRSRCRKAFER